MPGVIDNTTLLELGNFADLVLVTSGPAVDIERIPGFLPDGRPAESSGPNMERDFVFEYSGPGEGELQTIHDEFVTLERIQAASLIVKDIAGNEIFRWNIFEFGLAIIEPGSDGRNRYVMQQVHPPDDVVRFDEGPAPDRSASSNNRLTDARVEITPA